MASDSLITEISVIKTTKVIFLQTKLLKNENEYYKDFFPDCVRIQEDFVKN